MGNFIMIRRPGGQYKRYKDCLKSTLTQCGITPSELETLAMDRTGWRFACKSAVEEFEIRRIQELEAKRDLRKSGPPSTRCVAHGLGSLPTTSHTRDDETRRIDGSVHDATNIDDVYEYQRCHCQGMQVFQ